jgi:acyl-coenzyme A synthetase/AMP-(fatty) acid ligase
MGAVHDHLPRSATGKLYKRNLRDSFWQHTTS